MKKKILLIITGSVASYKSMDLIRLLKKKYEVACILTKSACEFITPMLVNSILGEKAHTDLFSKTDDPMAHINLSRDCDLILVAPASADFIAKIANGYADDLASCVILAANKKIFVAPAMNEKMLNNSVTQEKLSVIQKSGVSVIEPETDFLACGEYGAGKMSAPEKIVEKIDRFFSYEDFFEGKKIVITGGATFEPIDSVRFIGNYSSGKQSVEIAKIFEEAGAEVVFIAANISSDLTKKHKIISVKTSDEMLEAVRKNIDGAYIFISAAAVSDFKVEKTSDKKIKKSSTKNLDLNLTKTVDILDFVGHAKNRPQFVVGFAAEDENLENYAKEKLQSKNCDLVIANDIKGGEIFGSDKSSGFFVSKNKAEKFSENSKEQVALEIMKFFYLNNK